MKQNKLVAILAVVVVALVGVIAWQAFKPAPKSASDELAEAVMEYAEEGRQIKESLDENTRNAMESWSSSTNNGERNLSRTEWFDAQGRIDPNNPQEAFVLDYVQLLFNRNYLESTHEEMVAELSDYFADLDVYGDRFDRERLRDEALQESAPLLFNEALLEGELEIATHDGLLTAVGCARLVDEYEIMGLFPTEFVSYEVRNGDREPILGYAVCPVFVTTDMLFSPKYESEQWSNQATVDIAVAYVPEGIIYSRLTDKVPNN